MRAEAKAAVVCCVGALLWFAPWLLPGKALLGTHPALFRPFEEAIPAERLAEIKAAAHPLYSDKLLQHDPEVRFTLDEAAHGDALPAWNPQVLGGIPHLATGLSSALYPLMGLSRLVAPPRCYALIALLQTALCGWFAFLMLRAFHVRAAAAGSGALLFAASGWMSVHQEYFQLTAAATWLPLALFGAKRLLDRRGGAFALGAAVGCAFLSGFPQIAVYSLLAPALLGAGTVLARIARREEPARRSAAHAVTLALPALLGLAIASPQLLTTAELVPLSTRRPLDAAILEPQALPPVALASALLPDLLLRSRSQAQIEAEKSPIRQQPLFGLALLGDPAQRNNRFETTFALGPAALLFALLGLGSALGLGGTRRGARAFFVALLAVGLALVLPGPLLRLAAHVPGLNVGDPKRALLLVELALAALAAFGIERTLDDPKARRHALLLLGGAALLLGALAGAAARLELSSLREWAAPRVAQQLALDVAAVAPGLTDDWLEESRALLVHELLVAAAFTALAFVALGWRHLRPAGATPLVALPLALAPPLALIWLDATTPIPTRDLDAAPSLLQHFRRHPPSGRILRVGARHEMPPWPPKLPMAEGVRDAQGYVAVYLERWRALFEAVDPGSSETVGLRPLADPRLLERPLFDELDVEYALAALPRAPESPLPPVLPVLKSWQLVPLDPPQPESAPYQLVLWRNEEALGRAHVVRRVQVAPDDAALLRQLAAADFVPRDEAWIAAADAAPLLASGMWTEQPAERGAARTLAFAAAATDPAIAAAQVVRLDGSRDEQRADELRFRVSGGGGLLVQSDCWYPGWRVLVDGASAELLRVDHALRGVVVPPGEHDVRFHYFPGRLTLGLFILPTALAGLVLASVLIGRRRNAC